MGKEFIRTHEVRMQEAQQMNLLSDTFMNIAFKDLLACQYALRKLTGIRDLVVKQVRTQYRTTKQLIQMICHRETCQNVYIF